MKTDHSVSAPRQTGVKLSSFGTIFAHAYLVHTPDQLELEKGSRIVIEGGPIMNRVMLVFPVNV